MLQPFPRTKVMMTCKENCPLKNLPRLQFESYKIPHVAPFEALSFNYLLCNLQSLKQKTQIKRERESLINIERMSLLGIESGERKKLRNFPLTASSDSPHLCHHQTHSLHQYSLCFFGFLLLFLFFNLGSNLI